MNGNRSPIFAHRGCSGAAPENSMAAFRLALADIRITGIELDVQLSKDGVPVVIHDHGLRRTTNRRGLVKDHTFDQLCELDNGSWFSPEFHKERIPSLEQVLQITTGRIHLNIELKTNEDVYPGIENEVIRLIKSYAMENEVVITSFDANAIKKVKQIASNIRTGLIVSMVPITILDQLRILGADLLSVDYRIVEPQLVERMMDLGFDVMVWTMNDRHLIKQWSIRNPRAWICTNYPERAFM